MLCLGYFTCARQDETKNEAAFVNQYHPGDFVQLTLQQPLVEKPGSYKAIASVNFLFSNASLKVAPGKIIIYFTRDSVNGELGYGSILTTSKPFDLVRSSGNPGSFDYRLYCQRQGIYHTVYLSGSDYHLIQGKREHILKKFLFASRQKVLDVLSEYILGATEAGFAKALLIGYKDDLDKNLVQAYSNTGVVHIIAISGLHLGIIFWLLTAIVKPFQKKIQSRWPSAIFILLGLWLFCLLAGAGPSVLRSAFMFSIIVLGRTISKNSSVFNNLAFSAFALLCLNPYWLWDAGFQLSYAAVLSILIFFRPIYNWFYCRNKIVDFAWKLSALTLAAQVLTLPISIYHFHQLPVYFLLSNLVAVPLSSLILIGEILLCLSSFFPPVAYAIGSLLEWMIQFLNEYVGNANQLPFAVWDQLQISYLQLLLMFGLITGLASWVMLKQRKGLWVGLFSLLLFLGLRSYSFHKSNQQLKLIVYNLQNARAIDFIAGRKYQFEGDSFVLKNPYLENYNLKPARTLNRVEAEPQLEGVLKAGSLFKFGGKNILIPAQSFRLPANNFSIDILILSKNPKIQLSSFIKKCSPQIVIADASNQVRLSALWKKECDSFGISYHNVRADGAYVLNLR
jgi:competence protein ComEC